ncbi:MAG: hypothetical protein RM347_034110 [Nostoc sp. ChiQUE02]|uniref:hypothetical protein n=1 Tax=Nostoc sp. ChiQUE02 TaxID=3075377 RepID=UPI002AD2FD2E|nr:hypothetical protein [Nostoc sp. ChiQUE02]MDZ8230033.1 hypothetical protein [Nostoc sp. ChiQUE02]
MSNEIRCLPTEDIEINCNPLFKKKFNSNFWESLHSLWKSFVKKLLADPNELQVWQKVDRHGNTYWQAYDPATGKSFSSGSQADICMWIEQLYRY